MLKKLPVGIQGFREIIEDNYVYVDKTQYVYNLINSAKYYFLSRPRRFGKSLLIDTIAEAFSGDKELFKGLYLYGTDHDFAKHPVLRFDMSNISNKTPEALEISLSRALQKRIRDENLDIVSEPSLQGDTFKYLIEALFQKYDKRVVVLIDEYDKPILDNLHDLEIAEANRRVLKGFYGILKSMDPYLRMTFITGVSKFTKTSIFSDMNNLFDITMTEDYSNICGIPTEEFNEYFSEHIEQLAALKRFKHYGNLHDEILRWYDGYSWDGETRVINPFGLLTFFAQKRFMSFWYSSGSPKFLIDLIKNKPDGYTNLTNPELSETDFDSVDINDMEAGPLLFQTGYLTVKEELPMTAPPVYRLEIPNFEVRLAFNLNILAAFAEKDGSFTETAYRKIKEALESGNLDVMLAQMRRLFSSIPYQLHISSEAYYHSIFYAMLNLLGFDILAEVSVSGGRIDATLELDDKVYILEFKYVHCERDTTSDEKKKLSEAALTNGIKQIKDRGYSKKYEGSGKTVIQAAFVFLGRDDIEMMVEASS